MARQTSWYARFKLRRRAAIFLLLALVAVDGYYLLRLYRWAQSDSNAYIYRWFTEPSSRAELATVRYRVPCPAAPFILPSDGLVGLLWSDPVAPYNVFNPLP